MTNQQIPGCCPFWSGSDCCLTGSREYDWTVENKCKVESNCKTCGNYEAWKDGRNYNGWVLVGRLA
ncbi:MAG: hypothetical protein LBL97_02755 [Prevotellaceae bacterium]|nr:hypothetical protein [Prevotellaceae bacterium]